MTTFTNDKVPCGACGALVDVRHLMSTNTMGAPDLDLRPAEMMRSTMPLWVQSCTSCGYCSHDVKLPPADRGLIESPVYQQRLRDPATPPMANRFLCQAFLDEARGDRVRAGWAALRAAWCCDDAKRSEAARAARTSALRLFDAALEHGEKFARDEVGEDLVRADLLRRVARFEEALQVVERALTKEPQPAADIFQFVKALIAKRDVAAHSIAEVGGR